MSIRKPIPEWAPQDGVILTWPHQYSDWKPMLEDVEETCALIVAAILEEEAVILICYDTETKDRAFEKIEQKTDKLDYLFPVLIPTNDTWSRDFSPLSCESDGFPILISFRFNGWGGKYQADQDSKVTDHLVKKNIFKVPVFKIPCYLEGGALDWDDAGRLFATTRSVFNVNRNPAYTQQRMENLLRRELGIRTFLWLHSGEIPGDDTDSHIDTLVRVLPGNQIVYCKPKDSSYPGWDSLISMEKELLEICKQQTPPLEAIPIPLPDPVKDPKDGHYLPATYANFLFLNHQTLLLPIYQVPEDEEVCHLFKKLLPEYKIVPIPCRSLIRQHGSLHCMTMQLARGTLNWEILRHESI